MTEIARQLHHPDLALTRGQRDHDRKAAVLRAIVDKDQFHLDPVKVFLDSDQPANEFFERLSLVTHRHNNRKLCGIPNAAVQPNLQSCVEAPGSRVP